MPEQPPDGAAVHEQFIRESRAMDLAFAAGRFDEWLKKKIAVELGVLDEGEDDD